MDESKIDIVNPFGPAIAKVKMPENIVNKLNEYVPISERTCKKGK